MESTLSLLMELLVIIKDNCLELFSPTFPNANDDELLVNTGYGEVPIKTTRRLPPSVVSFRVSVTVPKILGL